MFSHRTCKLADDDNKILQKEKQLVLTLHLY